MSQEVVIRIHLTLPDGASYQVVPEAAPDFEREPLPAEPVMTNGGPVNRTMAHANPGPVWAVGQVHEAGHQPLKPGNKGGLFCPSKVGQNPDGSAIWCKFKA